jgi:hypothetical protein
MMPCTSRFISSSLPAVLPLVSRNNETSIGTVSIDTASTCCATPLSVSRNSPAVRLATTRLPRFTETFTSTLTELARKTGVCAAVEAVARAASATAQRRLRRPRRVTTRQASGVR